MIFKELEYISQKDGTRKRHPIKNIKVKSVKPVSLHHRWNSGICLGITLPYPEGQETEYGQELYDDLWGIDSLPFIVWLIGPDDVKIPLNVAEGNGWSEKFLQACIFGYLSPTLFE